MKVIVNLQGLEIFLENVKKSILYLRVILLKLIKVDLDK